MRKLPGLSYIEYSTQLEHQASQTHSEAAQIFRVHSDSPADIATVQLRTPRIAIAQPCTPRITQVSSSIANTQLRTSSIAIMQPYTSSIANKDPPHAECGRVEDVGG